jgi:hypothetical protein
MLNTALRLIGPVLRRLNYLLCEGDTKDYDINVLLKVNVGPTLSPTYYLHHSARYWTFEMLKQHYCTTKLIPLNKLTPWL